MMSVLKGKFPKKWAFGVAALAAAGAMALPHAAQARVFVNFGIGLPVFYGPHYYRPYYYPYYAPGPVYYAPPPAYYAPPAGGSCYAGSYVCPLHYAQPVNAACSCPTDGGGRVGGYVR